MLNAVSIAGEAGGRWNQIPTSCHFATVYWLFEAEFRRAPTADDYTDRIQNPTGAIRGMLAQAARLTKPLRGHLRLSPNSVVVFVKNGEPLHSCVARGANTLAGYNQVNWFSGAGADHRYSTHAASELKWSGALNREVDGNTPRNSPCRLVAIREFVARAAIRQVVQG